MKIISIEENIGSGKSIFLQYLKEHLASDKICFLDEPVDDWLSIVDTNDKNILESYNDDQNKYAFPFQMLAYISRLSLLKKTLQNNTYDYIITERSLFADRNVFCKMLYDDNLIEKIEYTLYNKWFDEFNMGAFGFRGVTITILTLRGGGRTIPNKPSLIYFTAVG